MNPMSSVQETAQGDWDGINRGFYRMSRQVVRFIRIQSIRQVVFHRERTQRPGGYLLACSHLSHIEPFVVGALFDRPVHWMSRLEFYRHPLFSKCLDWLGAFSVNRAGVPVSSIRRGIRLAQEGRIVGIFPEGGCVRGANLIFRGGKAKQGVCTIAMRAQVPVVPVVVLGTHRMTDVDSWLPALQGRVWVAFGNAVTPPAPAERKTQRLARHAMAEAIEREFIRTYRELLEQTGVSDRFTP
jgi:1-acyl-sn-glycerol-3-phosphate acyltransferase